MYATPMLLASKRCHVAALLQHLPWHAQGRGGCAFLGGTCREADSLGVELLTMETPQYPTQWRYPLLHTLDARIPAQSCSLSSTMRAFVTRPTAQEPAHTRTRLS